MHKSNDPEDLPLSGKISPEAINNFHSDCGEATRRYRRKLCKFSTPDHWTRVDYYKWKTKGHKPKKYKDYR